MRMMSTYWVSTLKPKRDIDADRPARNVRALYVRGTQSDPLYLLQLVENVEYQAPVHLVHVGHTQPLLEVAQELGAAHVTAPAPAAMRSSIPARI